MPSQRSDNSCSEEVGEAPLTLSDIIPPPSHHSRNSSRSSLVEEDSSVLKSIMGQVNTTLPVVYPYPVTTPRSTPHPYVLIVFPLRLSLRISHFSFTTMKQTDRSALTVGWEMSHEKRAV